nr:putative ribonuclease H-like domain-containing protein [Tanacetum cinerariifolium]
SAQSRKQDDKTKKEAKGKSHVESFTGYRDLSAEFEGCSDDSINEVNAAGSIVPIVGQNSPNNTNTFSAAGPSNAAPSPTYGRSAFIDTSQLPNDPDIPELEDITYSDDDNDVGAEDDFNNLETSIIVSHILTTRVHKDHPVSQIIELIKVSIFKLSSIITYDYLNLKTNLGLTRGSVLFALLTSNTDSLLSIPFWAEAVNTACYVQNKVLVTKPHNKTPYELLHDTTPSIGFMRPFGYLVTILNILESLGKFNRKVDEGFLVGYSLSSKAFREFNSRTRIVQETLHVNFLENKPSVAGSGPTWLFDIDSLTTTMNYQPVAVGNQTNLSEGEEIDQQYVIFLVWSSVSTNPQNNDGDATFDGKEHNFDAKKPESEVNVSPSSNAQSRKQDDKTKKEAKGKREQDDITKKKDKGKSLVDYFIRNRDFNEDFEDYSEDSSNDVSVAGPIFPTAGQNYSNNTNLISAAGPIVNTAGQNYSNSTNLISAAARIEAIRLFLDYASFMGFMVYQMDVESEFLYGTIKKEVYVCQPPGFEDPDYPDKVYKVVKALYGLHQAPRAWYETLSTYLLKNSFHRGQIDQTLFIKKQNGDILLVKIYMDDIIFGATNKDLCKSFEKLMKDKF